ncbi:hypothetical protein N7520_007387 [Penicillium odoratum]|uniref:uncharacterized protein n=1 Tax=Penicillium odoratum TaxID=1167516 RepID=UPI00254696E3|nr:uncharacterized protein N7520_007387 [Penicillium odoratum]KAJ5760231.1 hypothetical protein N7520_007387 [Penicillium odoratum]
MSGTEPHNGTPAATPRRLLLASIPRSASNLLLKILNIPNQPNLFTSPKGGYFFYPAFIEAAAHSDCYINKTIDQWTDDEKRKVKHTVQDCFNNLEASSTQAENENQMMFTKEHAYWLYSPAALQKLQTGTHDEDFFNAFRLDSPQKYGTTNTYSRSNETLFSDEYLRSWQFAFIIRHPALSWPSMYRAMRKLAANGMMDEDGVKGASFTNMNMHWTRQLYDWCMEQPDAPIQPPIIDAHDLIHHPEVVLEFCERTGLDKSVVQFEWKGKNEKKSAKWGCHVADPNSDEVIMHQQAAVVMLSTLENSSGIVKDKAPESVDIDAEAAGWKVEFGEEVGRLLEESVRGSMPDYEYLKARRITV